MGCFLAQLWNGQEVCWEDEIVEVTGTLEGPIDPGAGGLPNNPNCPAGLCTGPSDPKSPRLPKTPPKPPDCKPEITMVPVPAAQANLDPHPDTYQKCARRCSPLYTSAKRFGSAWIPRVPLPPDDEVVDFPRIRWREHSN